MPHRLSWGRAKSWSRAAQHGFRQFLESTVEPRTAVLLAGILSLKGATGLADPIPDRATLAKRLDGNRQLTGDALVGYVETLSSLDYSVRYNLACYYSKRKVNGRKDEDYRRAFEELREFKGMPTARRAIDLEQAGDDPALEGLRNDPVWGPPSSS